MEETARFVILLCSFAAATVYLIVAAVEDYKTLQVSRWKHLICLIPAVFLLLAGTGELVWYDVAVAFLFALLFIAAGIIKIYGLADGFIFANLTLYFCGLGGTSGVGLTILILILASLSFLVCQLVNGKCRVKDLMKNRKAAFVPHIGLAYGTSLVALLLWR